MSKARRTYISRTRKARMRDAKPSLSGWVAMFSALAAAALFFASVALSFYHAGDARFYVGSIGLIGLVLAVGAFVLGVIGVREVNVRPFPPRTGLILGAVMSVVLIVLYAYGF